MIPFSTGVCPVKFGPFSGLSSDSEEGASQLPSPGITEPVIDPPLDSSSRLEIKEAESAF